MLLTVDRRSPKVPSPPPPPEPVASVKRSLAAVSSVTLAPTLIRIYSLAKLG